MFIIVTTIKYLLLTLYFVYYFQFAFVDICNLFITLYPSYIYIKIIFLLQRFFWFYHPNHHFIGIFTLFLVTFLLSFSYIVDLFLKD